MRPTESSVRVRDRLRARAVALIWGPELAAHVRETARRSRVEDHVIFGDPRRVTIAATAVVNDALFNVSSGEIRVGDFAFFGHGVHLLTGTHDVSQRGEERQRAVPPAGRDIDVEPGAWIASGATVLGPSRIGAHAVVAAGAVVVGDVPPHVVVAGVPARQVDTLGSS